MASDSLAVAALVLSGAGIVVSLTSAISARRSANAARDARHEAREPRIEASVQNRIGGDYVLRVRNAGPSDLDDLDVEIVPGRPVVEPLNIVALSLHTTGSHGPRVELGPLRLGEGRDLEMWRDGPHRGGVMRLRCAARSGRERWAVLVVIDLPQPSDVW